MNHTHLAATRDRTSEAWKRFRYRLGRRIMGPGTLRPPRTVNQRSPEFRISRIDDPDGAGVLIGVRGLVSADAIEALHAESDALRRGALLHLDLTRAAILMGPSMGMLEALVDALEARGVRVRVMGISPHHPALRKRSKRLDETL